MEITGVIIGAMAAIVGGVGGGLLSGRYQDRRDQRDQPQLKLEFDVRDDKIERSWKGDYPFNGIVFRASLHNEGITSAINCRVFVTNLKCIHTSGATNSDFKDSRQIAWAGWSFEARAVPQAVTFYVDFLRISKESSGWIFTFEKGREQDKALQAYKGTYRFQLVAVADNAKPAYLNVDVEYNGDWNNLRAWKPST